MRELQRADLLIAADGGVNWCLEYEVRPDVVTGDMDSADPGAVGGLEVLANPDQETNDLEKALDLALERGAASVTILGATGGRLDHSLKNISVLAAYDHRFSRLLVKDDDAWMRVVESDLEFFAPVGTTVSLFPVTGKVEGIHTIGLRWALRGETLENGVRDGSSNESVAEQVQIRVGSGKLLVMVFHHPEAVE